jgi:hypothetical protein
MTAIAEDTPSDPPIGPEIVIQLPPPIAPTELPAPAPVPDEKALTPPAPVAPVLPVHLPPAIDHKSATPPTSLPDAPALEPAPAAPPSDAASAAGAPTTGELAEKLATMGKSLEALSKNLTITTGDPNLKMVVGGVIVGDFLFNTARPVAPGTPFFLAPAPFPGFDQQTFDAQSRQSIVFAYVSGPKILGFDSSGLIAACFYDSSLIQDLYGFLPIQAYVQLKDEYWRYAAGVMFDIFNPLNPNVLPFSILGGSGNAGAGFPAQARVERYFHLADDAQITAIAGVSNPISTTVSNTFQLSEDNGWPNVEGRIALGLGCVEGEGLRARRPFEVGFSGLVGQIRTTLPMTRQVVADVWGLGVDARWALSDRFGVQGEVFTGQTLGTYTAGILQNINAATFAGVHASGGWVEMYYYICPETWHTHIGYGVDDPLDRNLAPGQPVRNETYFANLIWDPNKYFRMGLEVSYRKTAWTVLQNNDGVGVESQIQFKF